MNIAILGGSFDPPHLGHILIAQQVLEYLSINDVWLMPCYKHDFDKPLTDPSHRLAMTKLLANKHIAVSDFEMRKKSVAITINTLRSLSKIYPEHVFSFIIGSDQLPDFHKWDQWQRIIEEFSLIIFPREIALPHLSERVKTYLKRKAIPKTVTVMDYVDLALTNVSSTIIRDRVKKGLPIDLMVPKEVDLYIKEHKLYA